MNDYIFEFIKDVKGNKVGVIVATVYQGMIVTGYSKTNLKEGDIFDKDYGIELALNRAKGYEPTVATPDSDRRQFRNVQVRGFKYFQQATFMSIAGNFIKTETKEAEAEPMDSIDALQKLEKELISKLPQETRLMLQGLADSLLDVMKYKETVG